MQDDVSIEEALEFLPNWRYLTPFTSKESTSSKLNQYYQNANLTHPTTLLGISILTRNWYLFQFLLEKGANPNQLIFETPNEIINTCLLACIALKFPAKG